MEDPRWLVDEMLGRLARYLRMLGYDAEYVRGADDDRIVRWAQAEERRLLTRDRRLAQRTPGAIRIESSRLLDQLRSVRAAWPTLRLEPLFVRCTLCNGELRPELRASASEEAPARTVFRCERCGHRYWEGTHTRDVRAFLRQVPESPP